MPPIATARTTFREGAGRACLDFIRTMRHRNVTPDTVEELPDPAAFAAWVRQFGPLPAELRDDSAEGRLGEIHAVREAVFQLADAAERGQLAPPAVRATVNRAARAPVPVPQLGRGRTLTWHADDPTGAVLSALARDAIDLVTSPTVERLRHCADPTCRALFVDLSRPGRRRWCSMGSCGNRAKKDRFLGR
jgi:predicted RNA-binding Zn ribbon-like protein